MKSESIKNHENSCDFILRLAKTSVNYIIQGDRPYTDKTYIPSLTKKDMMSETVEGCRSYYELRHSLQQIGIDTKVTKKFGLTNDFIEFNPVSKTLTFNHSIQR